MRDTTFIELAADFDRAILFDPEIDTARFVVSLCVVLTGGIEACGKCPLCGTADSFVVRTATGSWACSSCHAAGRDALALCRRVNGWSFEQAAAALGLKTPAKAVTCAETIPIQRPLLEPIEAVSRGTRRRRTRAITLWRQAKPIQPGTIAAECLADMGCPLPPAGADLRWIERAKAFGHDGPWTAARISAARDASLPVGVHLAALNYVGNTLLIGKRRNVADQPGLIRVSPDRAVTNELVLAIGIETALLASQHTGLPAWAAVDAASLARVPVLRGVQRLVIVVDASRSAQSAANTLATRWQAAGCGAIVLPAGDLAPEQPAQPSNVEVPPWA